MRTDRQTDGRTDMKKLIEAFRNFVNAPKKRNYAGVQAGINAGEHAKYMLEYMLEYMPEYLSAFKQEI